MGTLARPPKHSSTEEHGQPSRQDGEAMSNRPTGGRNKVAQGAVRRSHDVRQVPHDQHMRQVDGVILQRADLVGKGSPCLGQAGREDVLSDSVADGAQSGSRSHRSRFSRERQVPQTTRQRVQRGRPGVPYRRKEDLKTRVPVAVLLSERHASPGGSRKGLPVLRRTGSDDDAVGEMEQGIVLGAHVVRVRYRLLADGTDGDGGAVQ